MSNPDDFDGFSLTVTTPEPAQPRIPEGSMVDMHEHTCWAGLRFHVDNRNRIRFASYSLANPSYQVTTVEGLRQLARGLLEVADRIEK